MNKLIESFEHRLNLLERETKDISSLESRNNTNLIVSKTRRSQEVSRLKKELESLNSETEELVKLVFEIGKSLKDKVRKRDFENLKNKIDSWNLEDFMTFRDLINSFNIYSKQ